MRRKIFPYNPILKEYARKLRNNSTPGEIALWKELKTKKMRGYDFHRQKPILNYIVDFFCHELLLAIEIDGHSHIHKQDKDKQRDENLNRLGISVLRFTEGDARSNLDNVLKDIEEYIEAYETKTAKTGERTHP